VEKPGVGAPPPIGPSRLGAAGTAVPAPGPPIVPALADKVLVAADRTRLPLRVWLPPGEVKAAIVALHGFNDYSNAFAEVGPALARRGIAVYAYDQRGFGEAPERGRWVGTRTLAEDLATASRLVRARHPGKKLYLLGESMGGAVVLAAVAGTAGATPPERDGVILVAPAIWGRATQPFYQRAALWLAVRLAPETELTGRGIRVIPSDNTAMLRALVRDPLVIKATRIDTLAGLVDLMDAAYDGAPRLGDRALWLYGAHDDIVPRGATEATLERVAPAERPDLTVACYANGYHMLLRDLEGAVVLGDVASWIASPAATLPSGADRYAGTVLAERAP
jgi:alpha-beta hydrolase superfamily lysophospholipase